MPLLLPDHAPHDLSQRWLKLLSVQRIGTAGAVYRGEPDRTAFQQDYDRIVFSAAFRRMKDKTQVFPLAQSDYVRNRLTHSLEASCVGRSLGTAVGRILVQRHQLQDQLHASDFGAVVASACLAHDIGNPPFGHAGEDAIRDWFCASGLFDKHGLTGAQRADFERYEGNAQGFRLLAQLQSPSNRGGLQLTAAVAASFAKYPCPSWTEQPLSGRSAKKFGYFQADAPFFAEAADAVGLVPRGEASGAWRRHPLAFLVEAADDICYRVVDFEDAARLGVISYDTAESLLLTVAGGPERAGRLAHIAEPKERIEYLRAKAIGRLVEEAGVCFLENEVAIVEGTWDDELLAQSRVKEALDEIERISYEKIYICRAAMEVEAAGCEVLAGLLDRFVTAVEEKAASLAGGPRPTTRSKVLLTLLPAQFLGKDGAPDEDPYLRLLKVVDFVSGMTDSYAVTLYRRLKGIELPGA